MANRVLSTRLCELLDIEYPIMLAGMGGIATMRLAAIAVDAVRHTPVAAAGGIFERTWGHGRTLIERRA